MKSSRCTVIHYDYEGYYSKNGNEVRWNPKEDHVYGLMMTGPLKDLTYSALVDKLCTKMTVDKSKKRLKLSYFPLHLNRHSYISDDEELLVFLMEGNKNHPRGILHVEVIEVVVSENQNCEQIPREDRESGNDARNDEIGTDARDFVAMEDLDTGVEAREHYVISDYVTNISFDENDPCEEVGNADEVVNLEWEDGTGLRVGQEFQSKEEIRDLVDKASFLKCFQVAASKSSPMLLVLKCRASCCKWALRAAKGNIEDRFSIRTYNRIHTCSPVTTSTGRARRGGTPRLVASVLREEFQGVLDTPTPKKLIGLVERRYGVKVSYSTALRGRKKAASDVCGTPQEIVP